jgi:elongation factor Ts
VAEISAQAVKALREQTGAGMMDCKRVLADAGGDLKRAIELLRERGLAKAGKREGRATSEGVIAIATEGARGGIVELGCETDFVARTDDFTRLAADLARTVARDLQASSAAALEQAPIDGEKVSDRITAAIARLGENIVVKRAAQLTAPAGGLVGGYLHAGGKLGVLVALSTQAASGPALQTLAKDVAMHVAAADPTPLAVERSGVSKQLLDSERAIYRKQAEQTGKPPAVIEKIVEGRVGKFLSEVVLVEQPFVKDPDRSVGDLLREASGQLGSPVAVAAFQRFKVGGSSET